LRGQHPGLSAGVGVTTTDHALLANLTFASAGHTGFQAQGDVLDDLNILGVNAADSEFLVGTAAGALAWESGATARTSLGLAIGADVLAYDVGLQNLAGVAMVADRYYYTSADNVHVAGTVTAAGRAILDDANAAAQATTLGLGTGDSPVFAGLVVNGDAFVSADLYFDADGDIGWYTGASGTGTRTAEIDYEPVAGVFIIDPDIVGGAGVVNFAGATIEATTIECTSVESTGGALNIDAVVDSDVIITTSGTGVIDLVGNIEQSGGSRTIFFAEHPATAAARVGSRFVYEGDSAADSQMSILSTGADGVGSGGGLIIAQHDGTYIGSGHRMGYMLFGGGISGSNVGLNCGIVAYTTEPWDASGRGSEFQFQATPNNSTSRVTIMSVHGTGIDIDTGIINYKGTMGNGTDDPTTDAPTDWVEVEINGTTRYLPAYT
ncbi:hypothetical protein LCGC14_2193750, partial [marine sediment metagenome]